MLHQNFEVEGETINSFDATGLEELSNPPPDKPEISKSIAFELRS